MNETQQHNGLVSIITPMYNGADFVGEAIESVMRQSYPDWEMIIVDDCSPDHGAGIRVVEEYGRLDSRIRLTVLQKNRGASGARNVAIRAARGSYMAFLDADDLWDPDFLERQLAFLEEKAALIVYSSYRRIDEQTKKEVLRPFIVPPRVGYRDILKSLPIFPSTVLCHLSRLGKYYFREDLGSLRDDWAYWLYLLKNKVDYAYGNREILVSYRLRKNSVTANKLRVLRPHWNILRKVEKLSFFECGYYFSWWIWISYWKYRK